MDDSPDTSTVADNEGPKTTVLPLSSELSTGAVDELSTVVFISSENGKHGQPLRNSTVRLLQSVDGALISFRHVCYQYQVQTTVRTRGCRCRKQLKHIVKNVRLLSVNMFLNKGI